jgi:hypothetical protein
VRFCRTVSLLACVLVAAGCDGPADVRRSAATSTTAPPAAATSSDAATAVPAGPTDVATRQGPGAASTDGPVTAPAASSTEPVTSPGFPGGGPGVVYLTRIRVGGHTGFDRVVWEFDGPAPTFRAAYADGPVAESGSGQSIDVAGAAAVTLIFSPASGVDLSGEQAVDVYTGPDRLSGADAGTRVVTEIVETGDFESTLAWAVGVDDVRPFVVTTLTSPDRVVLDIGH